MKSNVRPLLVGEVNPYGADPYFALYPLPENAAGGRLARILDLRDGEYLRRFERANLCDGRWTTRAARDAAARLMRDQPQDQPFVLLGRRVASAFGFRRQMPFWTCFGLLYFVPHPSGLSRVWNDPGAARRTRVFLAPFLGCWGEADACCRPGCGCCDPAAPNKSPPPWWPPLGEAAPRR